MYRYQYLDSQGELQGPLWLSQIRDLYHNGRLSKRTEITIEGSNEWQAVEFHPEITSVISDLKDLPPVKKRQGSDPVRLLAWTIALFVAYATYVIVNWRK